MHNREISQDAGAYTRTTHAENPQREVGILGDVDAIANVAVKNLSAARKFYEDTLGLTQVDMQADQVIVYKSGNSALNVYVSPYAGTNQATAVSWAVEDIDGVVHALKAKGVAFEHYNMPGLTREGDVYVADGMKVAWFKDPDGNILNVYSGE